MADTPPRSSRRSLFLLLCLGALSLAVLLALGTWQVRRLAWKEALIERIDTRMASDPVPLAEVKRSFAAGGDVDYVPVSASGHFEHANERFFFATWKGQSGWYVYTPLRLDDGGALFVNRGFVPYDLKDPATRAEGLVEGSVTITGLARDPVAQKPSFILPDNEPAKNVYYWKDLAAMAVGVEGEVLPFFVDAGDEPVPGGLPRGGVTIVDLPNSHLQYAVTWYGLAAALVAVMGAWLWRRRGA